MNRLEKLKALNGLTEVKTDKERITELEAKTETEDGTTINDLVEALDILTSIVLGDEE